MIDRAPMPFPQLHITADQTKRPDEYNSSDILITNYIAHRAISIPMAV